uniref:Secreted protein n=1 Tax=Syphacia muris TaxID=451379 RepID=A0A0N5AWA6_9BILA
MNICFTVNVFAAADAGKQQEQSEPQQQQCFYDSDMNDAAAAYCCAHCNCTFVFWIIMIEMDDDDDDDDGTFKNGSAAEASVVDGWMKASSLEVSVLLYNNCSEALNDYFT